jgi:hypothetical protein
MLLKVLLCKSRYNHQVDQDELRDDYYSVDDGAPTIGIHGLDRLVPHWLRKAFVEQDK